MVQSFNPLTSPRSDAIEAVCSTDRDLEFVLKKLSLVAMGVVLFSRRQQAAVNRPVRIAGLQQLAIGFLLSEAIGRRLVRDELGEELAPSLAKDLFDRSVL